MTFSDPASVAVVGASDDPAKWGHWLARGALSGVDRRRVHLVNRTGNPVCDVPTVRSLAELPETPELVVLAVPAAHVPAVVDEALALGTRGFVGITAGLEDEAGLVARIRAAGARLLGPNCLGLFDAATDLHLAWGRFEPGVLGIVSQSGQVGLELAGLAAQAGLGVSRFVSVGNQADLTAAEALADLVGHEMTKVVGLYLESFADGTSLLETISALRQAGKPTVLLTVGESGAAQEAARSHTGALTSSMDVVDAACRHVGAIRVATPTALVDLASFLAVTAPPAGTRVGIVADSGGQGAIAADLASVHGLSVPVLSAEVTAQLPLQASTRNPVDLAGAGEQDLANYAGSVEALLRSGEVDSVVLSGYFGSYGADTPALEPAEVAVARRIGAAALETGVPVVVHSMREDSATVRALKASGVPVQQTIERAVAALAAASRYTSGRPPIPVAPAPVTAPAYEPGYLNARELIANVPFPQAIAVSTVDELRQATRELRAPYALKADWLEHKSEHAGVVLGLTDPVPAFEEMRTRLGDGVYVLEEMDTRRDVVEVIVGARRDPGFGPVVLVGAGGTFAELYRDTAVELAPVSVPEAADLLRRLRCAPLFGGWRGASPVDLQSLAEVVAAVSSLLAQRPDLAEIELNPVRVGADGALAVDALIIPSGESPNETSGRRVA
ncbi:acetate--CoA ligase family protein [Lentzea tibetensis]|uniref:Acetate--CoA ligase family protein n=1 Tax=Lentzea tibetensis TaxID=2591470 RepID=A0A563F1M3_9PSEU|nr:acetate--CoA ligase family protein [Lentzea tibetensis]TWP53692.1 acetate--CoA ligase family protein [Lentzea tibetensis]